MDMASVVSRKQDKSNFKTTIQKHEEPIYVNTQDESTTEPNDIHCVLSNVDKKPVQNKPLEKQVWQKLKDNAVLIMYVIQGLTLLALAVISVTLFHSGNDPVNGGWTVWAEWGQCSSTCGVGQQVRNRTCSNPVPKFGGTHCDGESSEYRICSATSCTALNGGWTAWTEWGQCSSTCGVGQERRHRMCSNPKPKFGGEHCDGESSEYRMCSATNCTDAVGFTASNARAVYDKDEYRLYFSSSIYASDDSFNMTSGVLTCKIPGLYMFTATIVGTNGYSNPLYCYLKVNGVLTMQIFSYGYINSYPYASGTVVVKLDRDDTVYLGSCDGTGYMNPSLTGFAGVLVAADHD